MTNRKLTIVGLDLSLSGSGVCVLDAFGDIIESYTIKEKETGARRLFNISARIQETCKKYDPTVIVIEQLLPGRFAYISQVLGELHGVIKVMLFPALQSGGVDIYQIPQANLKQFVTGKGNTKKSDVKLHIFKKWGKEFKTEDEADAYACCRVGMVLYKIDECTKQQRESLKKVTEGI